MRIRTHPLIYEINTWPWLTALSRAYQRPITLASIPAEVYDELATWGFDAIWLMGVWERSLAGRDLARRPQVLAEYRPTLPDLQPEDVVGSPYAIHRYVVDDHLGGPDGLAQCRAELARRGLLLILDYVPNHVAVDHPWLTTHPDALIHSDTRALAADPVTFFEGPRGDVVAHGRDPYFPAWNDTAQIDAFASTARSLARSTLEDIANQCDGVRCDMAMLVLNRVFASTWGALAGPSPGNEFWAEMIPPIKAAHPDFLFLAEVYWETEAELQALGFDYTYDKGFYDVLLGNNLEAARLVLRRPPALQARMVHFVENHDEPRAVVAFGPERSLAAAAASLFIPGARMLYQGQLSGWQVKSPVQLGRIQEEATDLVIEPFYRALVGELRQAMYHDGLFTLIESQHEQVLVYCWTLGQDWRLVIINYADSPTSVAIDLPDDLFPATLTPVQELFSADRTVLGEDGQSTLVFAQDVPAFGIQIWRPR